LSSAVQPVTFYVPASAGEPVEVRVAHSGLRMVLVNRDSVRLLGEEWKVLGVYFLFGPSPDPDRFRAYVGEVGRRDLLLRLKEHASQKEWWGRALLIASDEFNSAEIGWLEGRLYDVLNNAISADLMNKGRPGDDSIAPKDRGVLERYVEPITAALRACGAPPDTEDQKPPPPGKKRAYYRESVMDLIDAKLLKVGTRLHPLRKNLTTSALVLDDGSLEVGGVVFSAVSPAAQAVSGNKSEPGWEFWGAPSGDGGFVSLFDLRDRLRSDKRDGQAQPTSPEPGSEIAKSLAESEPRIGPKPGKRRFQESVKDLIEGGLLEVGGMLRPARPGREATAVVLEDGRVRVGDQVLSSLSAAATAVTGNKSDPGWDFWAIEKDGELVTLYELREQLRARQQSH
jgi:Restriction Enzyme Adenine Methylase Associated